MYMCICIYIYIYMYKTYNTCSCPSIYLSIYLSVYLSIHPGASDRACRPGPPRNLI